MTSGSQWNYYGDRMNDYADEDNVDIYRADNSIAVTSKFFSIRQKEFVVSFK